MVIGFLDFNRGPDPLNKQSQKPSNVTWVFPDYKDQETWNIPAWDQILPLLVGIPSGLYDGCRVSHFSKVQVWWTCGVTRCFSAECICSTALQPAVSSLLLSKAAATEGWGRHLGQIQALMQLCLFSPRVLTVHGAGPPAVLFPAFTATLPVKTNGTTQKINFSHLYENTTPPVRTLHHCF